MVYMLEKKYCNDELDIELTSYICYKQNIWFSGKDIASILGYSNTRKVLKDHVLDVHKQLILWSSGWGNESLPQQVLMLGVTTRRGNKMTPAGSGVRSSTRPAFTKSFLAQN